MNTQVENNLKDLFQMLGKGQFVEAMEKYLAPNVVLQEANETPKEGKEYCINVEKEVLEGVGEFIGYNVKNYAVNGNQSFYEAVMEYKEKNGNYVKVEQAVASKWENGKIVSERYYHA